MLPVISRAALEFESKELELKTGLIEESIEAVFRFTNTGDAPVTIKEMRSSCGCTVPSLDKTVYGPGEKGEIKALFTIGGRTGKQHKSISVTTDDPDNSNIQLSFTTTIPEWCHIEPRIIRWKVSDEPTTQDFIVEIADPKRVSVELISTDLGDAFVVEQKSDTPSRKVISITPKTTDARVTKSISLNMTGTEGERTETRETRVYCLIR